MIYQCISFPYFLGPKNDLLYYLNIIYVKHLICHLYHEQFWILIPYWANCIGIWKRNLYNYSLLTWALLGIWGPKFSITLSQVAPLPNWLLRQLPEFYDQLLSNQQYKIYSNGNSHHIIRGRKMFCVYNTAQCWSRRASRRNQFFWVTKNNCEREMGVFWLTEKFLLSIFRKALATAERQWTVSGI